MFRDLWSESKYFWGDKEIIYLQGYGEINALISGIKGAQTPLGASKYPLTARISLCD